MFLPMFLVTGILIVSSTLASAGMIEEVRVYGTKKNYTVDAREVPGMVSVFDGRTLDSIKFETWRI